MSKRNTESRREENCVREKACNMRKERLGMQGRERQSKRVRRKREKETYKRIKAHETQKESIREC